MWPGHEQLHEAIDGDDELAPPSRVSPGKRTLTSRLPGRASPAELQRPAASPAEVAPTSPASAAPLYRKALSWVDPFDFRFTDGAVAHRSADAGGTSAPEQATALAQSGGAPLSAGLRALFEPRFGQDFGDVRIHTGDDAAAAARSIDARAYTLGTGIVFGAGQYQPDSRDGQHLLAHELTHVVQQRGSVQRAVHRAGSGEASAAPAASGPAAQLAVAAAQLESLRALASSLFAGQAEHAATLDGMARGLAQLHDVIAKGDRGAQQRTLEELKKQLPPGLIAGLPSSGPAVPAPSEETPAPEVPQITEQRDPEIARSGFTVSRASDPAEQEAERVADAVMSGATAQIGSASLSVQRVGGEDGEPGGGDFDWILQMVRYLFAILLIIGLFLAARRGLQQPPGTSATSVVEQAKEAQDKDPRDDEDGGADEAAATTSATPAKQLGQSSRKNHKKGRKPPPPAQEQPAEPAASEVSVEEPASKPAPEKEPTAEPAPRKDSSPEPAPKKDPVTVEATAQPTRETAPSASHPAPRTAQAQPAPEKPAPRKVLVDISRFADDPLKIAEALVPKEKAKTQDAEADKDKDKGSKAKREEDPFLVLLQLMETHDRARVATIYQLCDLDLPRTRDALDALAPFPGAPVLQFVEEQGASKLAVAFLRSIRTDVTDASLKDWRANFKRWTDATHKELAKQLGAEETSLDKRLLDKFGVEPTRWAATLPAVDTNLAHDWIELTNQKGGAGARGFLAAHLTTTNGRQLYAFLAKQPDDPKQTVTSSALTLAYHKQLGAAPQAEAELVPDADGGGLPNNGTDCFLLAACQLLALPAYDGVELLPPVRAMVRKVQQRQVVQAAEIRRLRQYLQQLGLVEAVEHRHEDAAELLAKLLEASRAVRVTERHHVDEADDGPGSDPRARPTVESRVQYDAHADFSTTTDAEAMLQVPINTHDSLEGWLNGAHAAGVVDHLHPTPARPASYEWVAIGDQLRSVLRRTTRTDMHSLPSPLTIMLKRFDNYGRKLRKAFAMPHSFEVTEENDQAYTRRTYELRGIIYHRGNQGGGHYWAHRREGDDWLTANDNSLTPARQSLAPQEGDFEYDINHGYLYTYEQTGEAEVDDWAPSTAEAFDREALDEPALGPARGGLGKNARKGKDGEGGKERGDKSAKAGEESDEPRPQVWYGLDSLDQNRDAPQSADTEADPEAGHLNEGPCEAVAQALVDAMGAVGLTDSRMVGAVRTLSGEWYVAPSGKPHAQFANVVRRAAAATGLPLQFVRRSNTAPVHNPGPHDKSPKYIEGADVSAFDGGTATPGKYWNSSNAKRGEESAHGAPGTCALPKLLAHLIEQGDPPVHASEKWFSPKKTTVGVMVETDGEIVEHHHGDTVASCRTCRPIVAEQLRGVGDVVTLLASQLEQRKKEIAAKKAKEAQSLHHYVELARRQLPLFSVDPSQVNPDYITTDQYARYQQWYRDLVETMVFEKLAALEKAEDPRYTDADLDDEELDLELGEHLRAPRVRIDEDGDVARIEEAQAAEEHDDDRADEVDEAPLSAPSGKKATKGKKQTGRSKHRAHKQAAKSGKASSKASARVNKPKHVIGGADPLFLEILNELVDLNAIWSQIPAKAWKGLQPEGFDFELEKDTQAAELERTGNLMDGLRQELTRLTQQLSAE
jgi:predicted nucleotidyltransferase